MQKPEKLPSDANPLATQPTAAEPLKITPDASDVPKVKQKLRKYIAKAYFREGDSISERTDWSLIFHAILLEAFVASKDQHIQTSIGIFGLLLGLLWLAVGLRQHWNMKLLHSSLISEFDSDDEVYRFHKVFKDLRNKYPLRGWTIRAVPVFTIIIPAATTVVWSALLLFSGMPWCRFVITIIGLLIAIKCCGFKFENTEIPEELTKTFWNDFS